MAINRISGNTLQDDLVRGNNLSFQGDLLYIDVGNSRVGVSTTTPEVSLDVVGNINAQGVTLSGNITVDTVLGSIQGVSGEFSGNVQATLFQGDVSGATATFTGNIEAGNVDVTGNISATGAEFSANVSSPNFIGNVIGNITGNIDAGGANTQVQYNDDNVIAGSPAFTFDRSSNIVTVTGNIEAGNVDVTGNIQGFLGIFTDLGVSNELTGNNIDFQTGSFFGNVSAQNFLGNAVGTIGTFTGNVSADTFLGNISGNTAVFTGNITADTIVANVSGQDLTLSGNLEVQGLTDLGNIANVTITGGANLQYIQTDGTGNLTYATPGTAANVLYVSKSGNDANDGLSLDTAKLTIAAAVAIATTNTCIFVKSGDYTEVNPITVPTRVSIIGDNLRTVSIRPQTTNQDIFHLNQACYITGVTFRDHVSPAAAVAFPTAGAGLIVTSPYVQNCSSITTTGCGMRVDGNLALGLRSMVTDSYTQFNQGGIGIEITNQGYAQLVSIFTICCSEGIVCRNGGTCSITNSNSSFGTYGLVADGVGPTLYTGNVVSTTRTTATIGNLSVRPAVNDAFIFSGQTQYQLVRSATPLVGNVSTVTFEETLEAVPTPGDGVDFSQISLISASSHTFEYVGTGTNILTATPRLGGIPIQANEIREVAGGRVNFTSTDQFGDFRIGGGLVVREEAGVIEGVTFDRSLFAVLTPYILALEG